MRYPKIHTLYKRDEKGKILPGVYAKEEFLTPNQWSITEKIDGTNIRVYWTKNSYQLVFRGRNENSEIPPFLLETLNQIFDIKKFNEVFYSSNFVTLFGEGYGNKIQKVGSKYRKDNSFILFDCLIDGFWLKDENIKDIADRLGIESVPFIGIMQLKNIIKNAKYGFSSILDGADLDAEGIVARSYPLVLFRDTKMPLAFKLKTKDFTRLNTT